MKTYLNINTGVLSLIAGGTTPIRRLDAKRGDSLELEVVPSAVLPDGATGLLVAKPKGNYAAAPVALDATWDAPSEAGAGYLFALSLNTTELNALFSGVVAEITLMAEITWSAAGKVRSTQTFDLVVSRDVWVGDEGVPTDAEPEYPLPEAIVITSRTLTAAGLVTGGGNLTTDRTVTVTESADATALNETVSTTAVTPRRWWQRLAFWLADTTAKTMAGPLTLLSNLTVNGSDIRLPSGGAAFVDGASVATRDRGDVRFFAMVAQFEEGATTVSVGPAPTGGPLVWTWTIPDGYRGMIVDIIGAGGGGGAGRRGAAGSNRFGGGGGAPGAWNRMTVEIGTLASRTLVITLGAGGAGGPAAGTDDTNGGSGSTGDTATITSNGAGVLKSFGNYGGNGGTAASGVGRPVGNGSLMPRVGGGNGTTGVGPGGSFDYHGIVGGQGGAGLSATDTPASGSNASAALRAFYGISMPAAIAPGGAAPGGNAPTAGITNVPGGMHAGQGGGSGASNVGGTGGNGGNGRRGGGGGGGGASQNGFASGAGGAGGAGFVRITCY